MAIKKGPLPARTVFLLTFVIFIVFTFQGLWLINKGIEPSIFTFATTKVRQLALEAVNDAISKKIAEQLDIEKLIVIHNQEGTDEVSYSFDPKQYNSLLAEATNRVQRHLKLIEEGNLNEMDNLKLPDDVEVIRDEEDLRKEQGVIYWVPLGVATQNTLLANLGPRIPVRLQIAGNVATEIRTKRQKLGINNTYLELFIDFTIHLNVIIPSDSRDIVVKNSTKIGDLFIKGDVPQFYNGGDSSSSSSGSFIPVIPNTKN